MTQIARFTNTLGSLNSTIKIANSGWFTKHAIQAIGEVEDAIFINSLNSMFCESYVLTNRKRHAR